MINLLQLVTNVRKFHERKAIFAHKLQSALRMRLINP